MSPADVTYLDSVHAPITVLEDGSYILSEHWVAHGTKDGCTMHQDNNSPFEVTTTDYVTSTFRVHPYPSKKER